MIIINFIIIPNAMAKEHRIRYCYEPISSFPQRKETETRSKQGKAKAHHTPYAVLTHLSIPIPIYQPNANQNPQIRPTWQSKPFLNEN